MNPNEEMFPNAHKLAVAIGLLKDKKCSCGIAHAVPCDPAMRMPIIEINGVKNIDCHIEFSNEKKHLGFEIKADFKYDDEEEEHPRLYFKSKYNKDGINKEDILDFSINLLQELPHLELGLNGQLLIRNTLVNSMFSAFEDVFTAIECENVKVDKTLTCSVCYEKTHTLTPCKHPLCNRCWSKIETTCSDCDGHETPCPLCRENIYYV